MEISTSTKIFEGVNELLKKLNYKKLMIMIFVLLLLDHIWITKINKTLYMKTISDIQKDKLKMNTRKYFNLIMAYILIIILMNQYFDKPIDERIFIGLSIYGIFNFTNGVMFNKWNDKIILIDTMWGAILFTIVPIITNFLRCS